MTERTKLNYLQKMKDIISKMEMIENGSTMIVHDATMEVMEKLKEYGMHYSILLNEFCRNLFI